jgi:predicted enzyme related to lactoylglutathione lyase
MTQSTVSLANRPAWIELSTADAEAARAFYARLFGWEIDVADDPQYGGYGIARIGEASTAGIGPKQSPDAPTVWGLYIGTDDVNALTETVKSAGGTILAEPFDVGDQGRMAVFADPTGAVISAWQAAGMRNWASHRPNAFGWAEVNARGVDQAIPFYERVFGWTSKTTPGDGDAPDYTEFQIDGHSIAGALELNPQMPAGVPSYWAVYFDVEDVDDAYQRALAAGGQEMLPPQDFPGGRFAFVTDPQGASFGLLKTNPR